jgi:hypothetical protein
MSIKKQEDQYNRPAEYIPLKAKNPNAAGEIQVKISTELIDNKLKHDCAGFYELAHSNVRSALLNPKKLFEGVRDYEQGGFAYVCKPAYAMTEKENKVLPWPGKVFAVFVNPAGCIYNWLWLKESSDKPGYPVDWMNRFEKEIPV